MLCLTCYGAWSSDGLVHDFIFIPCYRRGFVEFSHFAFLIWYVLILSSLSASKNES